MSDAAAAAAATAQEQENEEVEIVEESAAEKAAKEAAAPINLRVVTQHKEELFFKVKESTKMGKLMDAFCKRKGCRSNSVRFTFDGKRIAATHTPAQLDMEDGDVIDVYLEMIGGTGETGKRRRDTKFHYDGYMVDKDDGEDRKAVRYSAEDAMLEDIVSALRVKSSLPDHLAETGPLPPGADADFQAALRVKRSAKEELNFVLALADAVRKRRLDFVAGKDNRAYN